MPKCNLQALATLTCLKEMGLNYFCLVPGLRSTPFAYALSQMNDVEDFVHFDERALGFHAMGYAKGSDLPAPIFITSGSSLANLMPSVVEAYQNQVPMLIFSADRPYHLRECGSNQTINQVDFFYKYVHFHQDLPLWNREISLDFLRSTLEQAYLESKKGPVHINCQFDEPFLYEPNRDEIKSFEKWKKSLFFNFSHPVTKTHHDLTSLNASDRGIIILGKGVTDLELGAILPLAEKLGWPIFADILASGHFGKIHPLIKHYDLLFKNGAQLDYDVVLQFKDTFTSKALLKDIASRVLKHYFLVTKKERRIDPTHSRAVRIFCDPISYSKQVNVTDTGTSTAMLDEWIRQDQLAQSELSKKLQSSNRFGEIEAVCSVIENLAPNSLLFLGASLPIRAALSFAHSKSSLNVFANRGASGIDGNLSTAFGISQGKDAPITLIVGDLTGLYDLNALSMVKDLKHPPKIIILNNFGGAIFSHLPQLENKEAHERYFTAKHTFSFEKVAACFGIEYVQAISSEHLRDSLKASGALLIEVCTNKEDDIKQYQEINQSIRQCFLQESMEIEKAPV